MIRTYAWVVYLAVGAAAAVAFVATSSNALKLAIAVALPAATVVSVGIALRIYRPVYRLPWLLLGVLHLAWAVGWIFWQGYTLAHGTVASVDSWQNILFLVMAPLNVLVLVLVLRRVDRDSVAFVDTAIVASALLAVAWPTLIYRYVENDTISELGRVTQISFAVVDVAIFAVALRILAASRRLPTAVVLLVASSFALLGSDALWNWSAQLGEYSPGSWADAGWMLYPVLAGAAVLHPSICALDTVSPPPSQGLRWGRFSLLVGAAAIPPIVLSNVDPIGEEPLQAVPTVAVALMLSLLILSRMALGLRDQERLTRRLNEQNEELRELDRLKDDFVASVSHELRTPLTSIRGYLELVLDDDGGTLSEEQRRFLSVVDRNSKRLLRVVSDLLFVAQVDAGKLALEVGEVDLERVAAETVEAARPSAEAKAVELVADVGGVPGFRGDASRLAQLFDNLVSNAVKFTPAGGRVDVRVRALGGRVAIEVADTGMGISREDQERLFARFFRTAAAAESAVQGTGLGLSIAKAIVEAHGGTIGVESEPGRGTTFRVELPLSLRRETTELAEAAR